MEQSISYVHRPTGKQLNEKVYGEGLLDLLLSNPLGEGLQTLLSSFYFPSKTVGLFESSPFSIPLINPFIKKFQIPMDEFIDKKYISFNDFFIRRFKSGVRPFENSSEIFSAPCEARYLFKNNVSLGREIVVKSHKLFLKDLLNNHPESSRFDSSDILIARLCPTDYHRFHFSLDGYPSETEKISGKLLSVNPKGISKNPNTLVLNERNLTFFSPTDSDKKIAIIEIGAMMVGKIIQSFNPNIPVHRGEEKGYFLFGASACAIVFEKGFIDFDQDLLENSEKGIETWIPLGTGIGTIMN